MAGIMQLKRLFGGVENMLKISDITVGLEGESYFTLEWNKSAIPLFIEFSIKTNEETYQLNLMAGVGNYDKPIYMSDPSENMTLTLDYCMLTDNPLRSIGLILNGLSDGEEIETVTVTGIFACEYDGSLNYFGM